MGWHPDLRARPNNLPGGVGDLSSDITVADIARVRFGDSTSADPNDNSGILRHVSIRHAGILDISEVKSLVLASVGRSTVIDYVEVFQGLEDGFYMMGGTVDLKHCISAFQAGDCFYYESGYQGRGQFLFGIQTVIPGGSKNGCMAKLESDDFGNTPLSTGAWYNMTLVGTGVSNPDTWKYKYGLYYKANGAGSFVNSILTQCSNYGVYVEDLGAGNELISSMARLNAGELAIHNNILHGFGKGNTIDSIAMGNAALQTYLTDARARTISPTLCSGDWGGTAQVPLTHAHPQPARPPRMSPPSPPTVSLSRQPTAARSRPTGLCGRQAGLHWRQRAYSSPRLSRCGRAGVRYRPMAGALESGSAPRRSPRAGHRHRPRRARLICWRPMAD